jgi:hypothetical protein
MQFLLTMLGALTTRAPHAMSLQGEYRFESESVRSAIFGMTTSAQPSQNLN